MNYLYNVFNQENSPQNKVLRILAVDEAAVIKKYKKQENMPSEVVVHV